MGFRYTGIRVRDLNRSIAFYTTVLGMQVTWRMRIRETGGAIAVLKSPRGSQRLELNWYPPRGRYRVYRQGDELDHLAFAVPDVDRFLREHRGDLRVDGDEPTAGSEDGSSEVKRGFRPHEVD